MTGTQSTGVTHHPRLPAAASSSPRGLALFLAFGVSFRKGFRKREDSLVKNHGKEDKMTQSPLCPHLVSYSDEALPS